MLAQGTRILIVGLGLIGGSYAEGLRKAGYEVGAVTRSQKTLDYALAKGIIDSGSIEVTEDYVSRFDIVVFALYPHVFLSWIERYQGFIRPGALLTDVTGVNTKKVVLMSDSIRFLEYAASQLDFIYYIPGKVQHIDFYKETPEDVNIKLFVDILMISRAEKAFLLQTGKMYNSGFPRRAAQVGNIPFRHIRF